MFPNSDDVRTLKAYCLFFGYGRSGHSLVGGLLDAHPEVIIAHEHDALGRFKEGIVRQQLLSELLLNSRMKAQRGRMETGYNYNVLNQWQGCYTELKVIGDKKGGVSTLHLGREAGLLQRFRTYIELPLKALLVVRNPYDIISSMVLRNAHGHGLQNRIDGFNTLTAYSRIIIDQLDDNELMILRHEQLIARPDHVLTQMLAFLGLGVTQEYLNACRGLLWNKAHKTRHDIAWDAQSIHDVAILTKRYSFLSGYAFDDSV